MIPPLETSRLLLRPVAIEDAEQVQQIFPRWEIVQYLAAVVPWPYPPDGALQYYRDVAIPAMERGDEFHWTIRRKKEPNRILGAIGLMRNREENRGFWLAPEVQGQGLMTEAATAVTDFWFDVLGETVLRVPKAAANRRSRRISERSGMRLVATFERDYVAGRLASEIWEITAGEWRDRR